MAADGRRRRVFVISDLHLGGAPGFQMCSRLGRADLARFIRWTAKQVSTERETELVVNGDIVDFLAEQPFAAFTDDADALARKLGAILERTAEVWDAFRAAREAGVRLVLLLGNHDIELSLPVARALIAERLGDDVPLVADNGAYTRGELLVEHGNRYDSWNAIPHDALRQVRSALSRCEPAPKLPPVPGSELVVRVMNGLKARYPFVDLLKPETSAALPLLAVLEPACFDQLAQVFQLHRQSRKRKFDDNGTPRDRGLVAAATPSVSDEPMLDLARTLTGAATTRGEVAGLRATVGALLDVWLAATSTSDRETQLRRLWRALRAYADEHYDAFSVDKESEVYLAPARAMAARGWKVVVFGHTHLAKRVALPDGAVYLNTGTWADLMQLPTEILSEDADAALPRLERFVDDLRSGNSDPWRGRMLTFACVDLDGERVSAARLCRFPAGIEPGVGELLEHTS
jgi:UDP-2,3-diacylglucosamine pyrophosphatase LpxH